MKKVIVILIVAAAVIAGIMIYNNQSKSGSEHSKSDHPTAAQSTSNILK